MIIERVRALVLNCVAGNTGRSGRPVAHSRAQLLRQTSALLDSQLVADLHEQPVTRPLRPLGNGEWVGLFEARAVADVNHTAGAR